MQCRIWNQINSSYYNFKICLVFCILNDTFTHAWVVLKILIPWVVKVSQFTFRYIIWKKTTFVKITTQKSLSMQKLLSFGDGYNFPKFWFLLESSYVIIGNKYCQLFSLQLQAHLICFEKMSARYSGLNNHSLSVSGSVNLKCVPCAFSRNNNHTSLCSRSALWIITLKKCVQRLRFNKINYLYTFKDILRWGWHCFQ